MDSCRVPRNGLHAQGPGTEGYSGQQILQTDAGVIRCLNNSSGILMLLSALPALPDLLQFNKEHSKLGVSSRNRQELVSHKVMSTLSFQYLDRLHKNNQMYWLENVLTVRVQTDSHNTFLLE